MKEKTQVFLLKALAALGLTLGLGPAALLLGRFFLPGEAAKWYVLWLLPFVWGVGSYACSGRMRLVVDLLGLIPLGALGASCGGGRCRRARSLRHHPDRLGAGHPARDQPRDAGRNVRHVPARDD